MADNDKVRENRLRRVAERRGMRIEKSKRRDPKAIDFGGYMLIDAAANTVISGSTPYPYSDTLDDIERMLDEAPRRKS
jgi:hypothetical protein